MKANPKACILNWDPKLGVYTGAGKPADPATQPKIYPNPVWYGSNPTQPA